MHDIDAQISRISGQQNYMDQLQRITGNIEHIDMNMYHEKHTKMVNCDSNIKKLLRKISEEDSSVDNLKNNYERESDKLNLKDNTFSMKQRKSKKSKKPKPPREIVTPGYRPAELVKTEWFKLVKLIEKDINKFLVEVFPLDEKTEEEHEIITKESYSKTLESKTFADLEKVYKEHPELLTIKTALDCKVNSNSIFTSILLLRRFCKIIINILLVPMYDVKGTINSHWSEINRIFKTKAFQQTKIASPEDIVNILHQFIIAKYRATITGNDKHYVKLFLDTIGNENVSNMDGARFMEIMDAIDLDKLNKKDKVYKFALGAKKTMQRIANNENITPEILKEFDEMFNDSDGENKEDLANSPEANFSEHADILT
jgi:hypothetical protein